MRELVDAGFFRFGNRNYHPQLPDEWNKPLIPDEVRADRIVRRVEDAKRELGGSP